MPVPSKLIEWRLPGALLGSAALHLAVALGVGNLAPAADGPPLPVGTLTVTLAATAPAREPAPAVQAADSAGPAAAGPARTEAPPASARAPMPERVVPATLPGAGHYYPAHELDETATPVNDVLLRYPEDAYAQGLGGEVRIRLLIDETGKVDEAKVVGAQPRRVFDDAALAAASQLRFSPALRQGQAVKSQKTIAIVFDPSPDALRQP